ncbi:MAG TPA: glycosyltransferase family A protein [Patescibacteria group bacterium]|nr:glycosyltransferase family A protein [Patescibacteria group bacterium]
MVEYDKSKISVVIATFNSERTIEQCLKSLSEQDYPQELIELIIADGGSTDNTLKIAANYGARIINVPKDKQGAEYNKGYGMQYVSGEFILCIDHDNILPHNKWLKKMLMPLLINPETVASEPWRYQYDRKFSLLDRYFSLFGVNDPLPYYLKKADRIDYIHNQYNLRGESLDKGDYYLVEFDKNYPTRIPTLGANGFLIRRSLFLKSNHEPDHFFHIDINVDLVKLGYNKYIFIKDDIIHLTNSRLFNFLKRRKKFMDQYYLTNFAMRRYSVYQSDQDKLGLLIFILYSVTLIRPLIDSIRGWIKIRDLAWFIHPLMCLAVVYLYGTSVLNPIIFNKKHQ